MPDLIPVRNALLALSTGAALALTGAAAGHAATPVAVSYTHLTLPTNREV